MERSGGIAKDTIEYGIGCTADNIYSVCLRCMGQLCVRVTVHGNITYHHGELRINGRTTNPKGISVLACISAMDMTSEAIDQEERQQGIEINQRGRQRSK